MHKNNEFDLEIDNILAEFSQLGDELSSLPKRPQPVPEARKQATETAGSDIPETIKAPESVKVYTPVQEETVERWEVRKASPRPSAPEAPAELPANERLKREKKLPRKEKAPVVKKEKAVSQPPEKKEKKAPKLELDGKTGKLIGAVFAVLSALCLFWVLFNVHPDAGSVAKASGSDSKTDLVNNLNLYMNNAAGDALGDLAYIRKIYTLEESLTVAPKPNQACYGRTTNPEDIQAVIDAAAELLEGQEMRWDPNVEFLAGSEIRYYLDDTILVIAWKEIIDGRVCTCAEVKIAHGSQLRRKLSEDTYGTSVQMKATDLAKQANSVIAINGDFYAFRNMGITGYQRQIYRCGPGSVDSCFFTADGDMLFAYSGDITTWDDAQAFMDNNNCTFAVAFGPVLIDNGELRFIGSYPIGEIDRTYSRAAIGMLDELHYMLMTVNYEEGYTVTATIYDLGRFMYGKGCYKAYTLDGGQTSVMVMEGETVNKVDWGIEREMSDIIYFATAIPESEVG